MVKSIIAIVLILACLKTASSRSMKPDIKVTSHAIASLINNLHEKHYMKFKLAVQSNDSFLGRLVDNIIKKLSSPIELLVLHVNSNTSLNINHEFSYVVLLQKENVLALNLSVKARYNSNKFALITFFKTPIPFFEKYEASSKSYKFFWIRHDKESIELVNAVMAQKHSCKSEWKSVASFNSSTLSWNTTNFITEYKDFFGCSFSSYLGLNKYYYWLYPNDQNVLTGVYKDLLDIFRKKYNIGCLLDTDKVDGETELIIPGDTGYHQNDLIKLFFVLSIPMGYEYTTFLISRGEQFSAFEKLLLPLDLETWIIVIVIFLIGYFTIFIIYQCFSSHKHIVFGKNMNDPSMSLTQIFFGIGLLRTPGKTFARVIFMIFTMYCLIIRTAYQGKMFDFLHSNAEKKVPKTLQDLLDQKTPVITLQDESSEGTKLLFGELNLVIMSRDEWNKVFMRPDKYGPDYTFAEVANRLDYDINSKRKSKKNKHSLFFKRMMIFKDNYKMRPIYWQTQQGSILTDLIQKFTLEAHQHGHLNYFISLHQPPEIAKPPEPGPQILTMKKLSAGFIVWLASVLIACISFLIEHLIYYITVIRKRKVKKTREKPKRKVKKIVEKPIKKNNDNKKVPRRAMEKCEKINNKVKIIIVKERKEPSQK